MAGPFPFEPPLADLKSLTTDIHHALADYEWASSPGDKAKVLEKLSAAANALSQSATHPGIAMSRFVFQPQANAAVRVAVGMGLFNHVPIEGPATTQELATKCGSEPNFTQRIARAVASLGFLTEVAEQTWAHNTMSLMLTNDIAQASLAQMFDNVAVTMFYLNDFHKKNGYKTAVDIMNTPTVFARGLKDVGYFDWLTQNPDIYTVFNKAMAFHSLTGVDGIANAYPWDALQSGHDGVTVIDVGGGKGHVLQTVIAKHPSISGHAVLEDLGNVLDDGSLVSPPAVRKVAYNFLEDEQPVKGASAYYFRHCLCDWPDQTCVKILQNQIPAMKGCSSRLLISDLVLPDVGVDAQRALRDINMMQLSGVERSEKEWHALLDQSGFRILNIYQKDDPNNAIIEAVLKE